MRSVHTRQSGNLGLTLLDNSNVEDAEVGVDNAATDGLALALTSAALAVRLGAWPRRSAQTTQVPISVTINISSAVT